jgi:hypothetical protein
MWFFVGHFLLNYSFCLISISESLRDPFTLPRFESPPRCFSFFPKFLDFSNTSALHLIDSLQKPFISTPWWFVSAQDFRTLHVYGQQKSFISALCYTTRLRWRLNFFLVLVLASTVAQFFFSQLGKYF